MTKRLRDRQIRAGVGTLVLGMVVGLCASRVVIATDDDPGVGCPHRFAELAATVHYATNGAYPATLDQLAADGFDPPNLSPDGLAATSDWWTLRMAGSGTPVFRCD